ncbi:hypothetical protein V6R86_06840 [Sphingomonas kaistensis]|uniref:Uncharacterized protein n=1 Tax=Sphingomonas kaistensis TaxID=298708 RepID=A0ABZ2G3I7_9SPHN
MQESIDCSASAMVLFQPVLAEHQRCQDEVHDFVFCDPLEPDCPSDLKVTLTHRQIGRLVFVAAETGSRFARERSSYDPAAWMAAPRSLFGGRNALTACVDRTMFMRAIVLHGATAVYDMAPQDMSELLASSDCDDEASMVVKHTGRSLDRGGAPLMNWGPTLFTATCAEHSSAGVLHLFFATIATDEGAAREQLRERLGPSVSSIANVMAGFDPSQPVAVSLLSEAMAYLLIQIAHEPTSALADGFNVLIEHRFDH